MANALQLRRGTTAQHSTFTGLAGEVTVDTTKDTVVVHDGSTAGGIPLATESSVSGKLNTAGGVITGNVSWGDNTKAQFGNSQDLQIYHSGNDSFIVDDGTGSLYVRSSSDLRLQATSGENYIICTENGAVTLYHDNSTKLATSSNGVSVTGKVSAADGHFYKATGNAQIGVQADSGIGSIEVGGTTGAFVDVKVPYSDDFDTRYGNDYLTCTGNYSIQHIGSTKLTINSTGVNVTGTAEVDTLQFSDGSTQTTAGASTGKAIAMAIVFG